MGDPSNFQIFFWGHCACKMRSAGKICIIEISQSWEYINKWHLFLIFENKRRFIYSIYMAIQLSWLAVPILYVCIYKKGHTMTGAVYLCSINISMAVSSNRIFFLVSRSLSEVKWVIVPGHSLKMSKCKCNENINQTFSKDDCYKECFSH